MSDGALTGSITSEAIAAVLLFLVASGIMRGNSGMRLLVAIEQTALALDGEVLALERLIRIRCFAGMMPFALFDVAAAAPPSIDPAAAPAAMSSARVPSSAVA